MASLSLIFDLVARNRASGPLNDVGDSADKAGSKIGAIGKVAGAAALGGVAVLGAGLISAFKGGLDELQANQAAMAQFTAGVEKTGGVANVTAEQMQALADSIEAKSGMDGAAITSGGAMLATFTKVRNEVGAGNDVFNRATQAGADLAARGFGSIESNAITLGKALQDPIKGVAALGKQGVTFSEEQKAMIKSLVATGDTLEAQKIVLKEVENQVGGSAEAYGKTLPGQTARAQAALDGVKETIVKAALPAFNGLLSSLNDRLFPAMSDLAGRVGPAVATFFTTKLVPAFRTVAAFVQENVLPVLADLATFFVEHVVPAARKVADVVLTNLRSAFQNIRDNIEENRPQLQSLVEAFRQVATFVVDKIVPLLGPILAQSFKTLGATIGIAIDVIAGIVDAFNAIKGPAQTAIKFVADAFLGMVETLVKGAARAFGWVPGIGPKLKKAAGEVEAFRDEVNRNLAGIKDKTVTIHVGLAGAQAVQEKLDRLDRAAGDGPGRGGKMLDTVQSMLGAGLSISSTYRTPARNAAVGGSPTSYHLDPNNPAVDVVGPAAALDRLYAALLQIPHRELLWRVPGHNDHLHVADAGGIFKGPGLVYMGAGQETFASGLAAKKIADLPQSNDRTDDLIAEIRALRDDVRQSEDRRLMHARTGAYGG